MTTLSVTHNFVPFFYSSTIVDYFKNFNIEVKEISSDINTDVEYIFEVEADLNVEEKQNITSELEDNYQVQINFS